MKKSNKYIEIENYEIDFDQQASWDVISKGLDAKYGFWKFNRSSFNIYYCLLGVSFLAIIIYLLFTFDASENRNDFEFGKKKVIPATNNTELNKGEHDSDRQVIKDFERYTGTDKLDTTTSVLFEVSNTNLNQIDILPLDSINATKKTMSVDTVMLQKEPQKADSLSVKKKKVYIHKKDTIYQIDTISKKRFFRKK